jgi:hypothetical protein
VTGALLSLTSLLIIAAMVRKEKEDSELAIAAMVRKAKEDSDVDA